MALTAIAIGIQSSSYSSFTLSSKNEEESLENMSTRTAMQKRIVEQLLGRTIRKWASQETRSPNAQGQTGENSPSNASTGALSGGGPDVVQISAAALEIHRKSTTEVHIEQNGQSMTLRVETEEKLRVGVAEVKAELQPQSADPLVMDLDGDGVELTDLRRGGGVDFDLLGVGEQQLCSWVSADDALLALDRDSNGAIDNGKELFGDQNGAADGFAELARFDSNRDGVMDSQDEVWRDLRAWSDRDQDGVSEADELLSMEQVGISSIDLGASALNESRAGNSVIAASTWAGRGTGSVEEVLLNYLA